jgi:hypothetical protein
MMADDVDLAKLQALVSADYVAAASKAFAGGAQMIVTTLTSTVTKLLEIVDPSTFTGKMVVAYRPAAGGTQAETLAALPPALKLASAAEIPATLVEPSLIEIAPNGSLTVYTGEPLSPEALSAGGIAYVYDGGVERIFVDGIGYALCNPTASLSIFVKTTYGSLEVALRKYRLTQVRNSSCYLFREVWADAKRLFLKTKPEADMRRSLTNYLRSVMDAEVMPEQNVDDTHPVDIKVTFPLTNRRALIEIKWMGDSHTAGGRLLRYRPARAREGAKQLVDYLDGIKSSAPSFNHRGYLVVIDARRRGLAKGVTSITPAQAAYYETRSVSYDAAMLARSDFAAPRRLFATAIAP